MAATRQPEVVAGWMASLPKPAACQLGYLRKCRDIEVFDDDSDNFWLRSATCSDVVERQLGSILGCQLFRCLSDGQLVPRDAAVPRGYVPTGTWQPLAGWLALTLPGTRLAAAHDTSVSLSLVRSAHPREPSLMRVSLAAWKEYAITAPQVRLARLRFAASEEHAVIAGQPLPQMRGECYYVDHGISAPVGYGWQPALDARVLREALQLGHDDVALLTLDGGLEVIRTDQFVAATPSAVRLTAGAGHVDR